VNQETRVILHLLKAVLRSPLPTKQLINMLIHAIESNEHMFRTDTVEKRLLDKVVEKPTAPISLAERRARRDTLQLRIVEE
jgi:hypothetical protein